MRFLFIVPMFFVIYSSGQNSIFEMLSSFDISKKKEFINENHSELVYTLFIDMSEEYEETEEDIIEREPQKPDTLIIHNDIETAMSLYNIKAHVWNGKTLTITTTSKEGILQSTEKYNFDDKGNIISRETVFSGESAIFNEKYQYVYDEKNRLLSILVKKPENEDEIKLGEFSYLDEEVLPISLKMNVVLDFVVSREPIENGYRYNLVMSIDNDLIKEFKTDMGQEELSDEEVYAMFESFGMTQKIYSDVFKQSDGHFMENHYKEARNEKGKIDLVSTIIFDSKLNLISKKTFNEGELDQSYTYEYTNDNRLKTITSHSGNATFINQYDQNGKIIKEYDQEGNSFTTRKYKDDRLVEERNFMSEDYLLNLSVFRY